MTIYPRIIGFFLVIFLYASAGHSGDNTGPVGEWLVKDKTAHIRVVDCSGKLWGVISWLEKPDVDRNNPDPNKRDRPMLGLPILLGTTPSDAGVWEGDMYNANNGKIYHGNVRMQSPNILRVKGCILGGLICGGENWTRITPDKAVTDKAICRQLDTDLE